MIKLKLSTLVDGFSALDQLCSLYLTGKLNFQNGRTLEDARRLVKTFDESKMKALEKYAVPSSPGAQNWKFTDAAKAQAYNQEIKEILAQEVEVYGAPYELSFESEAVAQLSGKQIADLRWLVTVIEPEEAKQPAPEKAKTKAARK